MQHSLLVCDSELRRRRGCRVIAGAAHVLLVALAQLQHNMVKSAARRCGRTELTSRHRDPHMLLHPGASNMNIMQAEVRNVARTARFCSCIWPQCPTFFGRRFVISLTALCCTRASVVSRSGADALGLILLHGVASCTMPPMLPSPGCWGCCDVTDLAATVPRPRSNLTNL